MKKTRIFFAYKHTNNPWGGANNFIRALYDEMRTRSDFDVHHNINLESDIIFFSQLSCGPENVSAGSKKRYRLSDIKKIKSKSKAKLVVRAVNLNINSHPPKNLSSIFTYIKTGLWLDIETIGLVNLADFVIFQSEFQKEFFKKWGYKGKNNTVIHNGAPLIFKNNNFSVKEVNDSLKLVSNSNHKTFKRHEIIAEMSLLDGVSITHMGNWSDKIKNHRVDIRGTLTHEEIVDIYKNSDYLLHPAINDPCPNSVVEALHFGLPVIYNNKKGSSQELVRGNGVPIDENNLEKTIQLARENIIFLKQRLLGDREYYSIKRAVSMYVEVFNKLKNR
ncbi:MAG: glycosyltransferase [Parcubacteria group bacterium]|jgi:glycosyltransferase involved in cell wall biosynthesis